MKLTPRDPTFRHPSWADYIAALPFLPNRQSRRQLHTRKELKKYLPVVDVLRHLAEKLGDPFCEIEIVTRTDITIEDHRNLSRDLRQAAELVNKLFSLDWYERNRNRRNALIAELRWTIREKTGKPHDRELSTLIDAAFQAAGIGEGLYLDATTLDRIEKREKESRVKATYRLKYLAGLRHTSEPPNRKYSTTFPENRGKRV